jgi:hypothetical protein
MSKDRPTREEIAEYINYDPESGVFRWKKIPPTGYNITRIKIGAVAGSIRRGGGDKTGHRSINIGGRRYPATHLAWLLMTGEWPSSAAEEANG